jgi:hypothetical protein
VVNCRPILHFSIILLAFTSQSHPQTRPFERTDHPGRVAAATAPGRKATSRFFATLPDEATITAMRVGGAGNVHLAGVLKPADPKSDEDYGDAFVARSTPMAQNWSTLSSWRGRVARRFVGWRSMIRAPPMLPVQRRPRISQPLLAVCSPRSRARPFRHSSPSSTQTGVLFTRPCSGGPQTPSPVTFS